VDTALRSSVPGVLAVGNLVHPVLTADLAAADASVAAPVVVAMVRGAEPERARSVPRQVRVRVGPPLAWVHPAAVPLDRVRPPRDRFVLWAGEPYGRPVVEVRQGGTVLWTGRARLPVVPGRPTSIPGRWVDRVEIPGPDVVVTAHRRG
jgi:hypothetical protein